MIKNTRTQLAVIGLIAALMGIGQNGLLVSLPFLVEHSAFGLSTWSILIAIGSFLFLPAAPYWGRFSDKNGPKQVVLQALFGMALSFLLLCVFAMFSHEQSQAPLIALIGLVIARIIYGCTVSGMVPASQHWAIILCGQENRLQAINSVSIGLSAGRLLGPLISVGVLKFSPFAPMIVMVALPVLALVAAISLPSPPHANNTKEKSQTSSWLPDNSLWPYLLSGLLLCTIVALLQYSFSPLIAEATHWTTHTISNMIGVLLTLGAACTFIIQIGVIRKKILTPTTMYRLGGSILVAGLCLFLTENIWWFGFAMVLISGSAALLMPAYTTKATEQQSDAPGAVAGYISMSHTLGYGLASLFAFTATLSPSYPIYVCIASALCISMTAFVGGKTTLKSSVGSR